MALASGKTNSKERIYRRGRPRSPGGRAAVLCAPASATDGPAVEKAAAGQWVSEGSGARGGLPSCLAIKALCFSGIKKFSGAFRGFCVQCPSKPSAFWPDKTSASDPKWPSTSNSVFDPSSRFLDAYSTFLEFAEVGFGEANRSVTTTRHRFCLNQANGPWPYRWEGDAGIGAFWVIMPGGTARSSAWPLGVNMPCIPVGTPLPCSKQRTNAGCRRTTSRPYTAPTSTA